MPTRKDAESSLSRLLSRFRQQPRLSLAHRSLALETLELRRLLTVSGDAPAITGTVFVDADGDGLPSAGEGVQDARVSLFLDDGNGIFDAADMQVGVDVVTDAEGVYCFDNLDGNAGFFVIQPAQEIGRISLPQMNSDLILPGAASLVIDSFETFQTVSAQSPAPSSNGSTQQFSDEVEVIGAERDMFVTLTGGLGEVDLTVNPFMLLPVLQYSSTSGVEGGSILTWDGVDNDPNPEPSLGLNGRDLTVGGANTGFTMRIGIDQSGEGENLTLSLFQGDVNNVSTVSVPIPVTDGTASAYLFIPFSSLSGPVGTDNVDAIQLTLGEGLPSADAQIEFLGVTGPQQQDFANPALPTVDLSVNKSDGSDTSVPGEDIRYTITVTNAGPSPVEGAVVADIFPPELQNVSYASVTTGTVSGNTPTGTENINDTVDMAAGSTITYTVDARVDSTATGTLSNTATVIPPDTVTDPDPTNNSSTDANALNVEFDLETVKTDGIDSVAPGSQTIYTITVTNSGPSDVVGATVSDLFPAELTSVSYTSTVMNGIVSGNTPAGTGDINDVVSMTAGSSLVYTASGLVDGDATGTVVNTASVQEPDGTTDQDPSNNSSTDTNTIIGAADLGIEKTDGADESVPGTTIVYTITLENFGPIDIAGATVEDLFPPELISVSYTSSTTGAVSGNTPSGSGDIQDTVDISLGSTLTYTVTATVDPSATGQLVNTATVSPPDGIQDPNPSNDSSTDQNTLTPTADLSVTKDDNQQTAAPGEVLDYTIVVRNDGPSAVVGATVQDLFPGELTGVTYSSSSSGGASGNTLSGTGNITDNVEMPVNSTITYVASGTVLDSALNDVSNTVTVELPANVVDPDPSNNSATDTNTLIPGVDLEVTKTNGRDVVSPGQQITYEIVVANNGPNPVSGAVVQDLFPPELTNVTYSSAATNDASGNTAGSGDIGDTLNLGVDAQVTYTVDATVDSAASGTLSNTATVTAPDSVTELDPGNNSSTDTDIIDQLAASISGLSYLDLNNNGVFDPDESPLSGVDVVLQDENRNEIALATTDENGVYRFDGLSAGSYFVEEIQPDDFRDGIDAVTGDIGEIVRSDLFFVVLGEDDNATGLIFGERPLRPSKRELLASAFRNDEDA